jgi:uncharacterized protein (DUF1330 family)
VRATPLQIIEETTMTQFEKAGANEAVDAQPSKAPPAYLVAEGAVVDPATFKTYAQQVPRTLAAFGGRFLVTGGKVEALEGDPPKVSVIIAFDSLEKANAWWNSPDYEAIKPIRHASAKATLFIIEGVPADQRGSQIAAEVNVPE